MSLQIRIAHRLASAHGHEWGWMSEEVAAAAFKAGAAQAHAAHNSWNALPVVAAARAGAELIGALTDAARGDSAFCGISAPHVREDGAIIHTTGTGRLEWEVMPDGRCGLTVTRPSGPVLGVLVTPEGAIGEHEVFGTFGPRHLAALADAVNAVAGPDLAAVVRGLFEPHIDPAEAAREVAIMASYAAADAEWATTQDALALEDDAEPTGPVVQVRRRPVEPVGEVEA